MRMVQSNESQRSGSQNGAVVVDPSVIDFIENWKNEFWEKEPPEETGFRKLPNLQRPIPTRQKSSF